MVDFSICPGKHKTRGDCPKRDSCQRYLWYVDKKSWSGMQSTIGASFVKKLTGISCNHYMKKWK